MEVRARTKLGQLKLQTGVSSPGAPKVILTGGTWFGTIRVRHKRLWES